MSGKRFILGKITLGKNKKRKKNIVFEKLTCTRVKKDFREIIKYRYVNIKGQ